MRVCTKCHAEKDDAEYVIGKTTRGACRDCRLKQRKEMNERYDNNAATIKKPVRIAMKRRMGHTLDIRWVYVKSANQSWKARLIIVRPLIVPP
jgi:hypothetical protein